MRDKFMVVCKKGFSKLNCYGNYSFIIKDKEYDVEILSLDYFCVLINLDKDVYIRIFESEYKEYFYTKKELRKNKLEKINLQK